MSATEVREVTEQNLDLLIETVLATGTLWFIWQAPHDDANGVSLHFGSGYELSIRWGTGNYGSRHYAPDARRTTVEVALFDKKQDYLSLGCDGDVLGWQDFGDIAALVQVIAENELERAVQVSEREREYDDDRPHPDDGKTLPNLAVGAVLEHKATERCDNGLCEKPRGHLDRCTEYPIPADIVQLYDELDKATDPRERWAIEDALGRRQA